MMVLRSVLLVVGVVAGVVGLVDLLGDGWGDVWRVVVWLAVGVVTHDAALSGLTILLGLLVVRLLPSSARAPTIIGLVVLGSVTLAVLPTLTVTWTGQSNPTLLDRPYVRNWLGFVGVVTGGVIAGSWWAHRHRPAGRGAHGSTAERRNGGRHPRG